VVGKAFLELILTIINYNIKDILKMRCLLLMLALLSWASAYNTLDGSTLSNVDVVQTRHFHLDVNLDFKNSVLEGTNMLTLQAMKSAGSVDLDF